MTQIPTTESINNVFAEFVARYGPPAGELGPERMVREVFKEEPDEWQIHGLLRPYGRGERRISVRSAHGPGKTCGADWCIWHQLLTRYPQKVIATAPTGGQLDDALVAELVKWAGRLPPPLRDLYEIKAREIVLKSRPKESFFKARTSRAETPEALQGVHCDPGWVLLVVDEASGVAEQVFESAVGSMSQENAQTLLLSNPVRTSGTFFDSHHKMSSYWHTTHVGYLPNADERPEGSYHSNRISDDYANDVAIRYGEDSNAYRVRVLGEFPKADDDTVIPYEFIASAQRRDLQIPPSLLSEVWGLDVARTGSDLSVLVRRNKLSVLPDIEYWGGVDLMRTAGRVKQKWDECKLEDRPEEILIDSNGLGAGVCDRLVELGLPARGINVSESAAFKERYWRLRDELWFEAREWLSKLSVSLPVPSGSKDCPFERLASDLATPRYVITSSGKLKVESKDDMKKRGFKSPNFADAFCLSFASEPATLIHGSTPGRTGWGNVPWNQTLKSKRTWNQ